MTNRRAFLQGFFSTRRFTDVEDLQRFHTKKLRKVLSGHNTQFYPDSDTLNDFPIINKRIFMQHFDQINVAGVNEADALAVALQAEASRDFSPVIETAIGDLTVGLSSGTSGNRGVFLVSDAEASRWAGTVLRRLLPRPLFRQHSVAFFLRANSNLYETVGSRLITFQFYDLLSPIDDHVAALNRQRPTVVVAPAQVLDVLAGTPGLSITPEKVISVAEVLTPEVRDTVEARFDQPVHQIYQCTEGFLGYTCSYANLHLNDDLVYVERDWLDEASGRFAPIITDLYRRTQPVIRYRLDDVLVVDDTPCPCGSVFTRLARIEGRCDDVVFTETTDGERYVLYPDFVRRAFASVASVSQYRVEHDDETLTVAVDPLTPRIEHEVRHAVDAMCVQHGIVPFTLRFVPYVAAPLHTKRRRVVRVQTVNKRDAG